ncbi:2OG-Fe(II) oxygenase family protein [Bradyrhizobium embrapense]|uniref:2OG-Fe(II) oxygenase family protein n=1 Tax=Bradyrhizobium embrapense TaxID=630921 RepID=UPI00067B8E61|nr:2OG-Fe(II) oxygenase family protein [Bradyrhizobium embrapense]
MATTVCAPETTFDRLADEGWAEIQLTPEDAEIIANVVAAAFRFFRADQVEKAKCQVGVGSGYRPYGIEYSRTADRPDEMETFSATASSIGCEYGLAEADELNRQCANAFDMMEKIADQIVIAIADGVTGGTWKQMLSGRVRHWSTLQINYSRPIQAQSSFINEEHEDGHLLTLVYSTAPGLEVRLPDGAFLPISTSSDRAVAMLGGLASLMTDGRLRPLFHQVRPPKDCDERISVLFFADLAPEFCQPWIVGESNRGIDIANFVKSNPIRFGLQKYGSD